MSSVGYNQEPRRLTLETPLGQDVLLLISLKGREEASRLSSFSIEMASESNDIDPLSIVGKNVTVNCPLQDGSDRYFNGFISRFACKGSGDRLTYYSAEVVPWIWFLTRTRNSRIFQNQSAVEIIKAVFSAAQFSDFEVSHIKNKHPQLEYCVQYRESDFNFVSRLMEEEGIYYYFRHEQGKHVLVLADQTGGYMNCAEGKVSFAANLSSSDPFDLISAWEHRFEFRPGVYSQRDYNFETPSNDLTASSKTVSHVDGPGKYEMYDYPGNYAKKTDGTDSAKMRMEEQEVACEVVTGTSRCCSFHPGGKFKLNAHHIASEENKSYVVTAVEHHVTASGSYETGSGDAGAVYENKFECIPDQTAFRPARVTPKPFIRGAQTAVVCGPSGQEIYVDKYGRVKVQFFWDRLGARDEKSSCWIRVAQLWTGNKWGAFHWPRISQEVVVSFLEGDPDRPIITGSVYNADRMPPYALPDEKTKSGLKSDSSAGGQGYNEIRFEDKKGSEQIFIRGEKDQEILVKNDCVETIEHDRHLLVKNKQIEHVQVDRDETIDQDHHEQIGRDRHTKISGKEAKSVGGTLSVKVSGDVAEDFEGGHSHQVSKDFYLKADNVIIEGTTSVTIKVGQNYIAIGTDGIKIGTQGTMEFESQSTCKLTATGPLSIQSNAQSELKAPMTTVQGDGELTLKGGVVMIN